MIFCLEQRESLEEENRQVHNTNNSTIERLQELETTSTQLRVIQSEIPRENISFVFFRVWNLYGIKNGNCT